MCASVVTAVHTLPGAIGHSYLCIYVAVVDLHEQRLKKLRELTKAVSEDDWMYPSADKLLGLK